jgi:hypothetical protein
MSNFRNIDFNYSQISVDAGGRVRTSGLTTLLDGKIVNGHSELIFNNAGTGTGTLGNSKYSMSVTSGQYKIWQSNQYLAYLSGKSQVFEETFDTFAPEANVIKRFEGFTSNAVAPYDTDFDGFYIESSNNSIKLVISNEDDNNTPNLDIDITQWSGYADLGEYQNPANWDNFTVVYFDFLWLGGAIHRTWLKTSKGFKLANIYHYSGTRKNTMFKFPCLPIRYEIRSTTGTGSFRYICSQVATEGDIGHSGYTRTIRTGHLPIVLPTVGTTYPLMGIRKQSAYRCIPVALEDFSTFVQSNNDILEYTIQRNPAYSAPLSWANFPKSSLQHAKGNGTITVTTEGDVLAAGYISQNGIVPTKLLEENFFSYLGSTINNTMDEFVLCGTPITTSISTHSTLTFKEF